MGKIQDDWNDNPERSELYVTGLFFKISTSKIKFCLFFRFLYLFFVIFVAREIFVVWRVETFILTFKVTVEFIVNELSLSILVFVRALFLWKNVIFLRIAGHGVYYQSTKWHGRCLLKYLTEVFPYELFRKWNCIASFQNIFILNWSFILLDFWKFWFNKLMIQFTENIKSFIVQIIHFSFNQNKIYDQETTCDETCNRQIKENLISDLSNIRQEYIVEGIFPQLHRRRYNKVYSVVDQFQKTGLSLRIWHTDLTLDGIELQCIGIRFHIL